MRSFAGQRAGREAISKQTYAILGKIGEIEELLRTTPELRTVIYEVHPEVCFCELFGHPVYSKRKREGREERRKALGKRFGDLDTIIQKRTRAEASPQRYP